MEPTPEELADIKTFNAAITWAGATDEAANAFRSVLGATGQEHPRLVGAIAEHEIDIVIAGSCVGEDQHPLALLQRKALLLAARACRLAAGAEKTKRELEQQASEQLAAQAAAAKSTEAVAAKAIEDVRVAAEAMAKSTGALANPKDDPSAIELSTVVNQAAKGSIPPLSQDEINAHYAAYKKVFKCAPTKDAECTIQQLTGLSHLLRSGGPPFVDFGIWGPNSNRLQRRHKFRGQWVGPGGKIITIELYGPGDFYSWAECYELVITGLLGFEAVDFGNLINYRKKIESYWNLYGPEVWALIYQADVRARLEEMERIRRRLEEDAARAKQRRIEPLYDYEEQRPWNSVWEAIVDDEKFWNSELEKKAQLILSKAHSLSSHIDGDAPASSGCAVQQQQQPQQEQPTRMSERRDSADGSGRPPPQKQPRTTADRAHRVQD